MAKPATPAAPATPRMVSVKVDGKEKLLPVLGTFGDKALHGSKLMVGTAKSDPAKRSADDVLSHDEWAFEYWVPANQQELDAFMRAKWETVHTLVSEALRVDARQASWHANRGGSQTVDVLVNGKLQKRVPKELLAMIQASPGVKVEIVERTRKSKGETATN